MTRAEERESVADYRLPTDRAVESESGRLRGAVCTTENVTR